MVDEALPMLTKDKRPLRVLFLDLNSYFASVEQQEHPELRGRPIAVVPVMADSSFVIAASYEAKRFGIKTGTQIGEAKRLCPEIELVHGNHPIYVSYHNRVIEAVETVLPVEKVCSIDEMRCRLIGTERRPANAIELAGRIKKALRERVGECLTASVGIAPNSFLAKVASDMRKPDGLTVLQADDLPHRLFELELTEFAGINRKMQVRLNASGIFTAEQMCSADRHELRDAFRSVVGERWWYLLRGYDLEMEQRPQQSMGHSHVLAPNLRNDAGCREVLLRLLHKAAARLRSHGLWSSSMTVYVGGYKKSWSVRLSLPPTQDTVTMSEIVMEAWETRDFVQPRQIGVTFHDLSSREEITPSLFDATLERSKFSHAVDRVNSKFGKHSVYLAGMESALESAPERIAFNKTWLFSEGKGDNEVDE